MPARLQRAAHRIVGTKQTIKRLQTNRLQVVYVAADAEASVVAPIYDLCKRRQIELVVVPTMAELGRLCAIEVGAAAAAIE
ncbi:MAG TPA: ribosomal L7Ae/L30e/S12e/Gadd45 family protein [Limnochordia bacterium]|nr:ribosomal L7Ae/L30e/S12e/Gadd45 family protein [Limnochordia bacterium]